MKKHLFLIICMAMVTGLVHIQAMNQGLDDNLQEEPRSAYAAFDDEFRAKNLPIQNNQPAQPIIEADPNSFWGSITRPFASMYVAVNNYYQDFQRKRREDKFVRALDVMYEYSAVYGMDNGTYIYDGPRGEEYRSSQEKAMQEIEQLIKQGVDVNLVIQNTNYNLCADMHGSRPLEIPLRLRHSNPHRLKLLQLLVDAGASTQFRTQDGTCRGGVWGLDISRYMSDYKERHSTGSCAILDRFDDPEAAKILALLIKAGANVNYINYEQNFYTKPLSVAVQKSKLACVRLLIDAQAHVAHSPQLVEMAAENNNRDICKILLKAGAYNPDVDVLDPQYVPFVHTVFAALNREHVEKNNVAMHHLQDVCGLPQAVASFAVQNFLGTTFQAGAYSTIN